jgi:hypothetical protein
LFHLDRNDRTILEAAVQQNDVNIFLKWYLDVELDEWQKAVHHAAQPNVTIIAGVGSGKTFGIAMSAAAWCASVPYFKFMNTAPTLFQSELMFEHIITRSEKHKYEKFIRQVKTKPYAHIELKNGSTLEFMSAADEIERLRGWEGDWMHLDEAGFITSDRTLPFMRTRLRGTDPLGRTRLGRLSVTTTATDEEWLWALYQMGDRRPDLYYSRTVTTMENTHITPAQVDLMIAALTPELQRVELLGQRPDNAGNEFPSHVIDVCEDRNLNLQMEDLLAANIAGAHYQESPDFGCYKWELPAQANHMYVVAGDPGQDNPPKRNSGIVMCFDVTQVPFELVYFHWVAGAGQYTPFLQSFEYAISKYTQNVAAGFDSTGAQKGMDELVFERDGLVVEKINFQGLKFSMMNALKIMLQQKLVKFPLIRGIRTQLGRYRLPDKDIPQDIVACFMIAAHMLRRFLPDAEIDQLDDMEEYTRPVYRRLANREVRRR